MGGKLVSAVPTRPPPPSPLPLGQRQGLRHQRTRGLQGQAWGVSVSVLVGGCSVHSPLRTETVRELTLWGECVL